MLHTFLRASNFRRWFARPDCPAVIKECKQLFDKYFAPRRRQDTDIRINESVGEAFAVDLSEDEHVDEQPTPNQPSPIPQKLQKLIQSPNAVFQTRIVRHGLFYTTSSIHRGNCLICFYPNGDRTAPPIPASIQFMWDHGQTTRLAVQRYQPLDAGVVDPFSLYPHFHAQLYSSKLDELELVEVDWVQCHFARYDLEETAVVLSLHRVGQSRKYLDWLVLILHHRTRFTCVFIVLNLM